MPGKPETERPLGHSLAPSTSTRGMGESCDLGTRMRACCQQGSSIVCPAPWSMNGHCLPLGNFPLPEEAPDETRSSQEPYNRGPGRSSPTLAAQPGHTSAFMEVCGKEQDLAFLAPFEYIIKTSRMKAKWDSPHKHFQPETAEVFILMGCCQLTTLKKNKRK